MPDEQRAHEQVGSPRAAQLGVARQAVRVDLHVEDVLWYALIVDSQVLVRASARIAEDRKEGTRINGS